MKDITKKIIFFSLSIWLCSVFNLYAQEETALKEVTFIPHWSPQAQFAGYYVAQEKGLYKKYGLDVKIIEGGPEEIAPEYLLSKKADFAVMWLSQGMQKKSQRKRDS